MSNKPTPPDGYEVMLGRDMPKPIPKGMKFYGRNGWFDSNLGKGVILTHHVDLSSWCAIPILEKSTPNSYPEMSPHPLNADELDSHYRSFATEPKKEIGNLICPPHYAGKVTPWDLEKCMASSGDAFVDSRRTDAIEYCFRMKADLIGDLRKAKHCLEEAIAHMEMKSTPTASQPLHYPSTQAQSSLPG